MSDSPITERQQYWLDHVRAAEAYDGSIVDYARSKGLKPKELYSWKGILARHGLLDSCPTENNGGFFHVIAPSRPLGMSLVLPQATSVDEVEAQLPVPNDSEDSARVS